MADTTTLNESTRTVDGTEFVRLATSGANWKATVLSLQGMPGLSTDNAIARWDGTTGRLLQDSLTTIDDSGHTNMTGNLGIATAAFTNTGLLIGGSNAVTAWFLPSNACEVRFDTSAPNVAAQFNFYSQNVSKWAVGCAASTFNYTIFDFTAGAFVWVSAPNGDTTISAIGDLIISNIPQTSGFSRVTSQFDKTADTALANVTGLTATLRAGISYFFKAVLYCTCAAAGGAKVAIAGTATATAIRYDAITMTAATTNAQTQATSLGSAVGASTTAVDKIEIDGLITVNASGTLTVQFAQNAASGTSSVLIGSHFRVWKVI